jgi:hypothetical protein
MKNLIETFNLDGIIRKRKSYTFRFVLLRTAFFLVSFFMGGALGRTVSFFLYPHIGNYCILVSIAVGFVIWRPITKYVGELEYRLYLKWM